MNKILIKWLKLWLLNCRAESPKSIQAILNHYSNPICRFEVSSDWIIKLYDESNFIKSCKLIIKDNYIKDIVEGE